MKKLVSLFLALCLCLGLTACGGGNDAPADSQQPESTQSQSPAPSPSSEPSSEPSEQPSQSPSGQPEGDEGTVEASLGLDRSDFTLFSAGASYTLKATVYPEGIKVSFTSDNEEVATVDEKGKVTAVAPGTAVITASAGELTASCTVRCKWEESAKPTPTPTPSPEPSAPAETGVDLKAFAEQVTSDYEFGFLQLASAEQMEGFYPGISAVATEQCLIYVVQMTMNNGEFGLVQVKDSKDVDTVKAIFQTRIDNMANGGAWYPGPTEQWTNNSRVVSNGNYIMMVVHEDCDAIVSAFNALF